MKLDDVDRMLRAANPVRDHTVLSVDITEVPLDEAAPLSFDRGKRQTPARGLMIALAAAVAAMVAVGSMALFRGQDDPLANEPSVTTEAPELAKDDQTAVDTVERLLDARNARDFDEAMSLMAFEPVGPPGAVTQVVVPLMLDNEFVHPWPQTAFNGGEMLLALRVEEILDVRYEPFECRPLLGRLGTDGFHIECDYRMDSRMRQIAGLEPVESSFQLRVRNAGIDLVTFPWLSLPSEFDGFIEWLATEHPSAVSGDVEAPEGSLIRDEPFPSGTFLDLTRRNVDLLEAYLDEYEGTFTGAGSATGLPGLPPEGATPSSPENGELVASMWEHIGAPGSFGNGWLYLYADGRLIWGRLDPAPTGGWLERRLTPEGVELVRSEIVASGLFDPDQPDPEPNTAFPREVNGGSIQVRNGDRLVYLNHVVPELFSRVADLWLWLPESAWDDTEARAFVPSRYAVCVHDGGYVSPADASDHLAALPAAAQDLLAAAPRLDMGTLVELDPAGLRPLVGATGSCFDVATDDARSLAGILDDAGAEQLPHRSYDGSEVTYVLTHGTDEVSTPPGFDGVTLTLWPMLPHGVPAFTGA